MRRAGQRGFIVIGIVLAALAGGCASIASGPCVVPPPPPGRDFLIIGHGGARNQACENTIESFTEALRQGANALELDVSMSRDGHLVLWHDWVNTLPNEVRPTGACGLVRPPQRRPIHELTLTEFMRDYGYEQEGRRVAVTTFDEFVRHFARDARVRRFFLDLKIPAELAHGVPAIFERAVQILRQHGALPKAVFSTPHEEIFAALYDGAQRWHRATGERVDMAFDTEGPPGLLPGEWPSAVQRNQEASTRFALWGISPVAVQSPRDFLAREVQRRNEVNATRPSQERLRFIIWTINDVDDMCAAVELGVDGIITDEPGRLRSIVRRGGLLGRRSSP